MRWLLAGFLMLTLVACGSGDDDDSGDGATPTQSAPTATATTPQSPTATVEASPTTAASPSAEATGQRGGIEPDSTAATGDPTPTRRPATVVTTPRPIFRTPTPVVFDRATPTPEDDGITVVFDDTFDDPAATTLFTGQSDFGVVAAVENGLYTLSVPEGTWQNIVATDIGEIGNGLILVEAGLNGDGAVGVVGRLVTNEDSTWTFYVCWLATDGRSGCHVSVNSEWVQLFAVEAGTVPILEVNELYLSVHGDEVYFDVNDIEIGVINDATSVAGTWGLFAESFTGTAVAWYDRVTIATIDQ
jgi:hypothetical protein